MDKKYNAIQTLKELDLSRGTRSSIGSSSGNSKVVKDFISEEKAKSKSKEKVVLDFLKDLPALKPKKLPPLELKPPKTPLLLKPTPPTALKPQKLPPLELKITNPLTGKEVSLAYYKTLVKSGKISDTSSQAKSGKPDFFSPPPLLEKPSFSDDFDNMKQNIISRESWFKVNEREAFLKNKNTPTDPKYRKEQQEKTKYACEPELLSVPYPTIGDMYGIYDDPERLLRAKPVIDKRLKKEWEKITERKDPDKDWTDYLNTFPPNFFYVSPPKPKSASPKEAGAKMKSASPPKKTRGRPKGSINKPKKKSSS